MPTFMKPPRLLSVMGEDAKDVRRALTIIFRGQEGIARADVERMFSFDMEWVAPHEAEEVVDALLAAGWVKSESGDLHLAVELGEVDVPFGWFPRPARLMRPVSATSSSPQALQPAPAVPQAPAVKPAGKPVDDTPLSDDPRARLTKRVARFIARQSGLDATELQRRAERKIRAFHLITPWMAYALVGREQGLVMDDIVQSLDVV